MKISCIFIPALCLISLLILTCESKPIRKTCFAPRIIKENANLKKKTAEFKKHFQDKIINVMLLTEELGKDFMANCSTRLRLLSFYANDVLSVGKVLSEAEKSGIKEDFENIKNMLQTCPSSKCEPNEETENMKELQNKLKTINLAARLRKAVGEFDILLSWIDLFIHDVRKKEK